MRSSYRIITAGEKWEPAHAEDATIGYAVTVDEIIERIRGTKNLRLVILETAEDEPPPRG